MKYAIILLISACFLVTGCEEESDLAIARVAAPVVIETAETATNELTATIFELDKSGILDQNIGIQSIPVPNLSVEVFASGASLGMFTTGADGSFAVAYADSKPNEFAGSYKGVAFRIRK